MAGGPMYAMRYGFELKGEGKASKKLAPVVKGIGAVLAFLFALFAVLASFGIGNMTQANSIAEAIHNTFGIPSWVTGLVLVIFALVVLLGGIKSIAKVCEKIVPFMAVLYFIAGLVVIIMNYKNLPSGLSEIFGMAFSVRAVAGGIGGSIVASMLDAMRWGVARGVFSNEAGLGSAPIAAAAAKTDHPSRQGYINMTGTFFDTIIVCSVTGLAIASSGVLGKVGADGEMLTGAALTIAAFSTALGKLGGYVITIGISLFAFSTILGWEYYGEKSLEYLMGGPKANKLYRLIFSLIIFIGSTTTLQVVWDFSDTMNGLMAIPNLLCLLALSNVVAKECFDFQKNVIQKKK